MWLDLGWITHARILLSWRKFPAKIYGGLLGPLLPLQRLRFWTSDFHSSANFHYKSNSLPAISPDQQGQEESVASLWSLFFVARPFNRPWKDLVHASRHRHGFIGNAIFYSYLVLVGVCFVIVCSFVLEIRKIANKFSSDGSVEGSVGNANVFNQIPIGQRM